MLSQMATTWGVKLVYFYYKWNYFNLKMENINVTDNFFCEEEK